jgi:3-oxoacyl-[acyl-carrier protein] reductase
MVMLHPDRAYTRDRCRNKTLLLPDHAGPKGVTFRRRFAAREDDPMDLGLHGLAALVTASSKGLGFAAARELAREGAQVLLNGRDQRSLEAALASLREEFGDRATVAGEAADLVEPGACERLVRAAVDRFGGLDILITNNGGPPAGTFRTTAPESWRDGVELTLLSAVRLIRAALPHLERSAAPSILTITSISVRQPIAGLHLSNAIRPAVAGLTKSLSQELGPAGIRVNSILPGWTATERVQYILQSRAESAGTEPADEAARIAATVPLGRLAEPAEFGRVAAFLVSPAASYLSGAMLQVDGGAYAGLL